jgi:hypothetical protein
MNIQSQQTHSEKGFFKDVSACGTYVALPGHAKPTHNMRGLYVPRVSRAGATAVILPRYSDSCDLRPTVAGRLASACEGLQLHLNKVVQQL